MTDLASRRAVLTSAVAGAAALAVISHQDADAASHPLPVSNDAALHAARRLTYGATPTLVAHLRSVGLAAWIDEQLTTQPDVGAAVAAPVSFVDLPQVGVDEVEAAGRDTVDALKSDTFARAVWGDHQLYEVLVELFTNHLSINADLPQVGSTKVVDDRDVIRAHVLGTYTDMLLASSRSPAMLLYLNNAQSHGPKPNENYARELLELHTVGVHAGYRGRDVRDAAKALTGLTVDPTTKRFAYKPAWHATGPVHVLGWSHPNSTQAGGQDVATSLVRYLASHPATAKRIAAKLVRRFVGDPIPPGLVASAAAVYLRGGTAITPVVRHVLLSKDFARSTGRKTQRPYEWLAASARALGLEQDHAATQPSYVRTLKALGQAPFEWRQPDGYPDVTELWATTASMLSRWNVAQALVTNQIRGFRPLDVAALLGSPQPTTAGGLVDHLIGRILLVRARPALRGALLHAIGMREKTPLPVNAATNLTPQLAALILSSPEAQVR